MAIRVPSGDLYADLGVRAVASPEEISAAFRALARTLHPDTFPSTGPDTGPDTATAERFKVVSAAYRVLSDPAERARYDATRPPMTPTRPPPTPSRPVPVPAEAPRQPMVLGWQMTRPRAHWVLTAGIVCLVLAVAVSAWVLADPNPGVGDQTGRTVTLWLVAAKLLVGGVVAVMLAARRLRNPLR